MPLTFDNILGSVLVIFTISIAILSLNPNGLRHQIEAKDRKGHVISTKPDKLNKRGKILILIILLSTICGIVKVVRDNSSQNDLKIAQNKIFNFDIELKDTVSAYKLEIVKAIEKQRGYDTTYLNSYMAPRFLHLQNQLAEKGYSINNNFDLSKRPNGYGVSMKHLFIAGFKNGIISGNVKPPKSGAAITTDGRVRMKIDSSTILRDDPYKKN